ncbi:hypothetical protein ACXYL9_06150 [Qipengyuania sp. CAU 1752]
MSSTNPDISPSILPSQTHRNELSVDLDTFTLLPLVAIEDTGWASLVPKMLTLEFSDTRLDRFRDAGIVEVTRTAIGGLAYWTTPLGDTIVNFRNEREFASGPGFAPQSGSDNFLLVSHTLPIGEWSIDLDYVASRNATRRSSLLSDGSDLGSYGISARYAPEHMPHVKLSLGRDNFNVLAADGDLRLRDRSLRAKADIDFSPWLQRKLQRDDIELGYQFQWDFDNSAYELYLLDEIIDTELNYEQSRGFLFTFAMKLP